MRIDVDTIVSFHYTLTDATGEVLDTSRGREPVSYLHGHGQIFPGLERQLTGLAAGDRATLMVPAAEGYGERRPELTVSVRRDQFPDDFQLTIGSQVMSQGTEQPMVFTIAGVEGDTVLLDGNHPLAGKDLHFDVEVIHVRAATAEELAHGHPHDGSHRH
jgi:FKBP-type peptidyl-prolyl cis-trans isomerase SlyD